MNNLRIYGKAPYQVAVIHGGPGAPGEMAPVARELSAQYGVLEPLQTMTTVEGQVEELATILQEHGELPVTLAGYSWGAMLSYIFTARYPAFVKKLVLVSSGPFEAHYAAGIMETRLSRLSEEERARFDTLNKALDDPANRDRNATFAQLGELDSKADAYESLPHENDAGDIIECDVALFESVWQEAAELRRSGALLELGRNIQCPVVAMHGDYDPHPAEGVATPLSRVIGAFRFILLDRCGHHPWYERYAREPFYAILKQEIA
jgi:pimeloyl-ACP methyl ester carboxylesterase